MLWGVATGMWSTFFVATAAEYIKEMRNFRRLNSQNEPEEMFLVRMPMTKWKAKLQLQLMELGMIVFLCIEIILLLSFQK